MHSSVAVYCHTRSYEWPHLARTVSCTATSMELEHESLVTEDGAGTDSLHSSRPVCCWRAGWRAR
jgi:hypothetical protein